MNRMVAAIVMGVMASSVVLAQNAAPSNTGTDAKPPVAASGAAPKIAPGSVIPVQLVKTIDAKKAKTGDEVVARVTMDMKTNTGQVMVPKDTKVVGHVTEAQARSKDQKESQLAIAFDHAVTKDGSNMPLPMSIQAIIGQQQNDQNAGGDEGPSPTPSGAPQGGGAARSPMGNSTAPQAPQTPSPSADAGASTGAPSGHAPRPPITAQTQGVIGMSNITLSPNSNAQQGSTVTSEKNNVKLESGTMLLLRVNQ